MRIWIIALAVGLFGLSGAAHAQQWVYQSNESAFGDDALHFAAIASSQYGFALRCQGDSLEAVYATPDRSMNEETLKVTNQLRPILRVRVDSNDIHDFDVHFNLTDGQLVAFAEVDARLFGEVRDAQNRLAVVLQFLGDNYHEHSFAVRGSTRALQRVMESCEILD